MLTRYSMFCKSGMTPRSSSFPVSMKTSRFFLSTSCHLISPYQGTEKNGHGDTRDNCGSHGGRCCDSRGLMSSGSCCLQGHLLAAIWQHVVVAKQSATMIHRQTAVTGQQCAEGLGPRLTWIHLILFFVFTS